MQLCFSQGEVGTAEEDDIMVSDQPDVGPINMHTSITATEARRVIIPTSGKNPV